MLSDSAQKCGQGHDVAPTVAGRKVAPLAGADVDLKASGAAVISRGVDRLPFGIAKFAIRQPTLAEHEQMRKRGGVNGRKVDCL